MGASKLNQWLVTIGTYCPSPIRRTARTILDWSTKRSIDAKVHILPGALAGFKMQGGVPRQYRDGSYELPVCALISNLVQPGWHCVDAGAHLGYFSLLLAKQVGKGGKITAFEAHPENARRLKKHLQINHLDDRVTIENQAVSNGLTSTVSLFEGRNDSSCEWNIIGRDTAGKMKEAVLQIPATSLDIYFPPSIAIDFIKMDIEGAEELALSGMHRILRESRPLVLVEFHNPEAWAARIELTNAGYQLYDVEHSSWIDQTSESKRAYLCLAVPENRVVALSSQINPQPL